MKIRKKWKRMNRLMEEEILMKVFFETDRIFIQFMIHPIQIYFTKGIVKWIDFIQWFYSLINKNYSLLSLCSSSNPFVTISQTIRSSINRLSIFLLNNKTNHSNTQLSNVHYKDSLFSSATSVSITISFATSFDSLVSIGDKSGERGSLSFLSNTTGDLSVEDIGSLIGVVFVTPSIEAKLEIEIVELLSLRMLFLSL